MQKPQQARQCQRHDEMREAAPWCGRLGDGDDGDMVCRKWEEKKGKKKKKVYECVSLPIFPRSISPYHPITLWFLSRDKALLKELRYLSMCNLIPPPQPRRQSEPWEVHVRFWTDENADEWGSRECRRPGTAAAPPN